MVFILTHFKLPKDISTTVITSRFSTCSLKQFINPVDMNVQNVQIFINVQKEAEEKYKSL